MIAVKVSIFIGMILFCYLDSRASPYHNSPTHASSQRTHKSSSIRRIIVAEETGCDGKIKFKFFIISNSDVFTKPRGRSVGRPRKISGNNPRGRAGSIRNEDSENFQIPINITDQASISNGKY